MPKITSKAAAFDYFKAIALATVKTFRPGVALSKWLSNNVEQGWPSLTFEQVTNKVRTSIVVTVRKGRFHLQIDDMDVKTYRSEVSTASLGFPIEQQAEFFRLFDAGWQKGILGLHDDMKRLQAAPFYRAATKTGDAQDKRDSAEYNQLQAALGILNWHMPVGIPVRCVDPKDRIMTGTKAKVWTAMRGRQPDGWSQDTMRVDMSAGLTYDIAPLSNIFPAVAVNLSDALMFAHVGGTALFEVGQPVNARWRGDGEWYNGVIKSVDGTKYRVRFFDGVEQVTTQKDVCAA